MKIKESCHHIKAQVIFKLTLLTVLYILVLYGSELNHLSDPIQSLKSLKDCVKAQLILMGSQRRYETEV